MAITTDRRRLTTRSDPAAEAAFRRGHGRIREAEVETARALARIHHGKVFLRSGCASAIDYAVADGMDRTRAREILNLGLTLEAEPRAADEILAAHVTPQAAAEIGRVLSKPDAVAPQDDWLLKAQTASPTQLRKDVRAAVEAHAQQDRVVPISFAVRESTIERFRRAHELASRKARCPLTAGQAFSAVTDDYLARHDPLLKTGRSRRVGPTSERPGDRYIPAEVMAAVRKRSGDRCEVPGCGNSVFLQFAHWTTHRNDGEREIWNLAHACTTHHTLIDAGHLRIVSIDESGVVFVLAATGERLAARSTEARNADQVVSGARESRRGDREQPDLAGSAIPPRDDRDALRRRRSDSVSERAPAYARAPPGRPVARRRGLGSRQSRRRRRARGASSGSANTGVNEIDISAECGQHQAHT